MTKHTASTRTPGWRDYRVVAVVAVVAAVLGFVGSYAVPAKYQAVTRLLVHSNTSYLSTATTQQQDLPQLGSTDLATALAATQSALTSSRTVAENVVNQLRLDQPKSKPGGPVSAVKSFASSAYHHARVFITYGSNPKISAHEAAVETVQNSVSATQVKDSYVIAVAATWDDPQLAAQIANAAADQLVADSNARYAAESQHYLSSLKTQLDHAQQAEIDTRQALSSYEQANDITDLDVQLQITAQNAASLEQQVTTLTAQQQSLAAQLSSVEATLAKTPTTTTDSQTVQTGRSSTAIQSTAPNTLYQSLATQAANLRSQIDGVQAQRDSISKALSSSQSSTTPLTATQAEASRLALDSTVASTNVQTLSAQYQQAQVAGTQDAIDVSRIDTATAPTLPVSPVRYMYLLVGLVIGALLSFILTHTRVLRRQRAVVAADDVVPPSRPEPVSLPANSNVDVVNLRDSPELLVHQSGGSPNGHAANGARHAGESPHGDG